MQLALQENPSWYSVLNNIPHAAINGDLMTFL